MKRIISLILAVSMLLAFIPASASAAEGEAFTVDFGTYDKSTAAEPTTGRYYMKSTTKGANWTLDVANTTCKTYYAGTTAAPRLQANVTIARRDRTDGISGNGSLAIKFTAPKSGVYDVSVDVYEYSSAGYGDVHLIDGNKRIYLGSFASHRASTPYAEVNKKMLSVTLEGNKEYSLAFTPTEKVGNSGANIFVYRTNFTPTDSPATFTGIEATVDETSITKGQSEKIAVSSVTTNGGMYKLSAVNAVISFKSSNESAATVSDDGTITAVGEGNATITATATIDGTPYTDTVDITVTEPKIKTVTAKAPKYVLLSDADGEAIAVSAKLDTGADIDMNAATVSYESLDTTVANVSASGVVTPVAVGTADIKITVTYEGRSADTTVSVPITEEPLPDGLPFTVDFRKVDKSTLVFPSNTTSNQTYSNKDTRGDNWTIDTANSAAKHYDGTTSSVRIQRDYAYIKNSGPFAVTFTVEESGKYDVEATVWTYSSCAPADFYIDGTYVGTIDMTGTVLAEKIAKLIGVELTSGTHSLIIAPSTNNAFVSCVAFTPVKEKNAISGIDASVESEMMYSGAEQSISVFADVPEGVVYDIEKGKTKFDGTAGSFGNIIFSGYDTEIISVSDAGVITALAQGNTSITVTASVDGEAKSDTIDIEIKTPIIDTVNVEAPRYILVADADGEALTVSAKMSNGADVDRTGASVTYENLTPKVADVSETGVVTPKKEGTAVIKVTVTYENNSSSTTVEIPITKESLPEGSKFAIDFGTIDISSAYTEDNTRYYAKAETHGENWALDTANTTSKTYYDNKTQGIRVAQPGITANNRTGDKTGNAGFAIKFTAPETGIYDVNAAITIGPTCGYVDVYFIEGGVKSYIGSYDSWDASSSYPKTDADLLSVSLEGGKEYSLMFCQSPSGSTSDRVYLTNITFTPVKVPAEVVGVSAEVDDNNIAAGESVDLIAAAVTSNGVIYEVEKSKKNPDGGLSITYRSSDNNIATVSDTGVIKAIAPGKVNITAEIELPSGAVSKNVQITVNENTYDHADVNIEEDSVYIVGGKQKLVPAAILSDGNGAALRDISARYESSDDAVAKIEDGVLVAVTAGSCDITAYVTFNGVEKSVKKSIAVENVKLAAIEAKTVADRVSALDMSGSQINVTGVLNNGEKINLADATFTFESLTPDIVYVDENGVAYYVTRGVGTVKVSTEIGGEAFECECEATSSSQKKGPTIYTEEMRAQALVNAGKYDWAKSLVKSAKVDADAFVENLDEIYDMIPVEGVPRASGMATWNAGANYENICPYCRINIQEKYGLRAWIVNPIRNPWKIQCPDCKRLFPSNDFESFYKLGITEDGVFDRSLALQKNQEIVDAGGKGYLVNELYPDVWTEEELNVSQDKASTWMVDDGFGWSDVDGTYGTQTLPKFCPVAAYTHCFWYSTGIDEGFFTKGIMALRDAYLYTGDAKYGRAGAILLDRMADVYPDFDLAKYSLAYPNSHGLGYNGKILGSIWETQLLQRLNTSYDAFYPMTDDPQVIAYLSEKAAELGLENKKTNPDMIRENMEDGLLRETFEASKKSQSNGNFGMHQLALTYAAVALDNEPETSEMFDWLGRLSSVARGPIVDPVYGGTWTGFKSANSGGDILLKYVRDVDRDGFGNEVGIGYNALWLDNGLGIAETINRYGKKTDLNLFENPKYVKMFSAFVRETLGDGYTIHLGDAGRVGGPGLSNYGSQALRAYNATKNPLLAQVYYFYQGGKLDDVYIDIFTDNDGLKEEIEAVIDTYGEYELISENMTGFGLAVLRGGEYIPASTGNGREQRYDTWMYSGITGGHGHYDSLALGIDAYGFNFMPDLGYPENTGFNPNRLQWIMATISHNTVVVDNETQSATSGSKPLHFDSTDKVKLIDVSSPSAYSATDIYRRTAVTIEASSEVAYTLDFFRVKGGNSHTYSFHTQSYMGYTTDDLNLVPQVDENGDYIGSYAGADVPYGEDPNTDLNSGNYTTRYTRGYTWLDNVNRAIEPETGTFSVNFEQTDFNKQVSDSKGLNLKFTALNDWEPSSVGIMTGYAPRTSSNQNVPGLDYMLIHREGDDLDTLFTSLLQPYKGEQYIKSASSVAVEVEDGRESKDDAVKAVKVELESGRVDYVIYATNNTVTYTVTDGDVSFNFRGFVGVYSINEDKENIYTYINDGDIIGDFEATSAYTGKVVDFTKELTDQNYITVSFDTDVDLTNLAGRYIYINNSGSSNGVYKIEGAAAGEQGNIVLNLGDVSVINGFVSTSNLDAGYTYNINAKQTFSIPLSTLSDDAPVFDAVSDDLTTSAGSSITVKVNAESPVGKAVTYEGNVLPRGASIDSETGTITWKPTSSQIGESGFKILAVDEEGRADSITFTVTVYGSTAGGGSGGSGGGGSSGQGTSGQGNTSTNVGDGLPDVPSTDDNVPAVDGESGSTDSNVRFADLDSHAWAEESINALAEKGIIQGTSTSTYSPAANIIRADFAILLVRAFELTSESTENFDDVLASDYFATELAIARNTGIINGIGDNKYAPRNTITRQDMMTIVYRALQTLEVELTTGEVDYADFDSVAEYAKEAVKALISSGLVNGKSGKIAPNDYTTRAEVAVLLKRILDYSAQK